MSNKCLQVASFFGVQGRYKSLMGVIFLLVWGAYPPEGRAYRDDDNAVYQVRYARRYAGTDCTLVPRLLGIGGTIAGGTMALVQAYNETPDWTMVLASAACTGAGVLLSSAGTLLKDRCGDEQCCIRGHSCSLWFGRLLHLTEFATGVVAGGALGWASGFSTAEPIHLGGVLSVVSAATGFLGSCFIDTRTCCWGWGKCQDPLPSVRDRINHYLDTGPDRDRLLVERIQ